MKRTLLAVTLLSTFGYANAALLPTSVLNFDAASSGGVSAPASGSWFSMLALDLDGNTVPETNVFTAIGSKNGITLGASQDGFGPAGTDLTLATADIDNPWVFFSNTGVHKTTSPVSILSDDGAGNVTLDFSGWNVSWNNVTGIPMGAGAWGDNLDGVAVVTCAVACSDGDTYSLDYTATVPVGDPSNFGGVQYGLHLEGKISAVPVPAAVWLFGSGLVGLAGIARRRKAV